MMWVQYRTHAGCILSARGTRSPQLPTCFNRSDSVRRYVHDMVLGSVASRIMMFFTRAGQSTASRSSWTALCEGTPRALIREIIDRTQCFFHSAFDLLRYPTVTLETLKAAVPRLAHVDPAIFSRVHVEGRYNAHLKRQEADLRTFQEDEALLIDPKLDYSCVQGLSSEVIERLSRLRPANIVCPSLRSSLNNTVS